MIETYVLPKPKAFEPFKPIFGQEDKFKFFLDYPNNPAYKEETMQKIIASVDGLREHINNKREIIVFNNENWLKLNMLYKQTKDKRFTVAIKAFDESFRGGENHAYKLGFDNLVRQVWKDK